MANINIMDNNMQNVFTPGPPLRNPVILNNLFDLCPLEDLQVCRLVCNQWKSMSLKTWRSRFVIKNHLFAKADVEQQDPNREPPPISQILDLVQTPAGENEHKLLSVPFRNFRVIAVVPLQFQLGRDVAQENAFWTTCGGWMHFLDLTYDGSYDIKSLENVIFNVTPNLRKLIIREIAGFDIPKGDYEADAMMITPQRNLKHLEISAWSRNRPSFPVTKIFRRFPSLDTIIFHLFAEGGAMKSVAEVATGMEEVKKESPFNLPIKHLDVMKLSNVATHHLDPSVVASFRALKLPLQVLKFDLGFNTMEHVIQQILSLHSTTLESLKCFRAEVSPPYANLIGDFGVTRFNHLREMRLYGAVARNLNFLLYTPNLEILHVLREARYSETKKLPHILGNRERLGTNGFSMDNTENLKNVRLERMEEFCTDLMIKDPVVFSRLIEWMPNMARLTIPVNRLTFPIMCKGWKETLQDLDLRFAREFDKEVVTGIPLGQDQVDRERPPNISDVKENDSDREMPMSEHSTDHGFLHLPRLQNLFVKVADYESAKRMCANIKKRNPEATVLYRV